MAWRDGKLAYSGVALQQVSVQWRGVTASSRTVAPRDGKPVKSGVIAARQVSVQWRRVMNEWKGFNSPAQSSADQPLQ